MKTIYKLLVLAVVVAFGVSSCTDSFMEEKPKGMTTENAFSKASDVDDAVDLLYRGVSRATFGWAQHAFSVMGDDISTHRASNKALCREVDLWSMGSANTWTDWMWNSDYNVIKAANYILEGAEKAPGVSQETLNYALNSAHFWRAWAYFQLVRFWGPLPEVTTTDITNNMSLSTVQAIYDDIIVPDLIAAENLPANYTSSPQFVNGVNRVANSAAAEALLAQVYMTMAGWPLNLGTEYYAKAAVEAKKVIDGVNSGKYNYQLYDDYAEVFSVKHNVVDKDNKEIVLGVFYSTTYGTGDSRESCRGCINDIPDCAGGWCDTRGEIAMYAAMPAGPRKDVTYPPLTCVNNDGTAFPWYQDEVPEANRFPYIGKNLETDSRANYAEYDITKKYNSQFGGWGEKTHSIMRLSEVYLWYAEALGRSGQVNAEAINLLNTVRNRADGKGASATRNDGSENIYSSNMSASELAEAAYNEHGYEIAGEWASAIAPRAADMIRMDRMKDHFALRQQNPSYTFNGYTVQEPNAPEGTWSYDRMLAPYPENDRQLNTNLNITGAERLNMIK